jgi:catechol 2,3-dioxygenase-like lactoylglutathione lyase family enzyme
MFVRVALHASDLAASQRFYETVLPTLGMTAWQDFELAPAQDAGAVTRGLHVGFVAPSRAHVDAFWQAGVDAGYRDDGAPGPRRVYGPDYYGGFLLDPDGNSAEAVHHDDLREGGQVDHLWIRVGDVARAKAFYADIAAEAGLQIRTDTPERVQFSGGNGSFSLVAGQPSRNVHMTLAGAAAASRRDPDGNVVELAGPA